MGFPVELVSPHKLSRVGHCQSAAMILVMFWERQYFVVLASFSVNAHGLRHVTDKLASFFYLPVLADDTSTYSF